MEHGSMKENAFYVAKKVEGGHTRVVQLVKGKLVLLEKVKFFANGAVGHPIGSVFEVKNRQIFLKAEATKNGEEDSQEEESNEQCAATEISQTTVETLKKTGASGDAIVSKLVEESSTYQNKTSFAQEKYVKRKRRKHGDTLVFLRPTIRLLASIYYKKDTDKTIALRPDLLARVLSLSNVQHGSKALIMEQCQGLITAGVMERLGGKAICVPLHKGAVPQACPCFDVMDFPSNILESFYPVPLSCLFDMGATLTQSEIIFQKALRGEQTEESAGPAKNGNSMDVDGMETVTEKVQKRLERRERTLTAIEALRSKSMNSLIIAVQYTHPLPILKELMKYTAPSSPIVLYSLYTQPLMECYKYLRDHELAVDLHLTDSFYREHQVLPDRTHPEMSQHIAGGFILYGISVIPPPPPTSQISSSLE